MFKKNNPGCECCAQIGFSFNEGGWGNYPPDGDENDVDEAFGMAAPGTGLDADYTYENDGGEDYAVAVLGSIGDPAVVVGKDVERNRLLVQDNTGKVFTVTINKAASLLWDTGSDAASLDLSWVLYHHSWGTAVFFTGLPATLNTIGATPFAGDMGTFDATGNYIQGPTSTAGTWVDDGPTYPVGISGGELPSLHLCTNPSGDLYHIDSANAAGDANGAIFKNGAEYLNFNCNGTTQYFAGMYHDGTDLYLFTKKSGDSSTALYREDGTKIIDYKDITGESSDGNVLPELLEYSDSESLIKGARNGVGGLPADFFYFMTDLSWAARKIWNGADARRHFIADLDQS